MDSRLNEIINLREQFKPSLPIKVLFIAESPPLSSEQEIRFFYNPNQEKRDNLFKAIMTALYEDFLSYKPGQKKEYLERFKNDGFFLIDATDEPVNKLKKPERTFAIESNMNRKIKEIKTLVNPETAIILIKKNIYQIFNDRLRKEDLKVLNDNFLPFPIKRRGMEDRFIRELKRLCKTNGLLNS